MKKNRLLAFAFAVMMPLLGISQFQQYYEWSANTLGVDRGPLNECLTKDVTGSPLEHFACGHADSLSLNDCATLISSDNNGALNWVQMYQPNTSNCDDFTAISMADATAASSFGIICNHINTSGLVESLVLITDYNGAVIYTINLGEEIGTYIGYDVNNDALLALTIVDPFTGTQDVELTSINASTGAVNWERRYDGCNGPDWPACILVDGDIYAILGSSGDNALLTKDMMLIETDPTGTCLLLDVFGSNNINELVTDACIYTDGSGNRRYGMSGYTDPTNPRLFCAWVDPGGAAAGNYFRMINTITGDNDECLGLAIAWSDNSDLLAVCGRHHSTANRNGTIATFRTDATLTPLAFMDYEAPGTTGDDDEELRDITTMPTTNGNMLVCGFQVLSSTWTTAPAGSEMSWLMSTNSAGRGTCPGALNFTTLHDDNPYTSCPNDAASKTYGSIEVSELSSDYNSRNPCTTPSRMANPAQLVNRVMPNPASDRISISTNSSTTDKVEFELYDMTGRTVMISNLSAGTGTNYIDVSALASGAYSYSLRINGNPVLTNKIVIAH